MHAEAATGVRNDLAAIAKIAKSRNALIVVDAVASVGAEPLPIDDWDLDHRGDRPPQGTGRAIWRNDGGGRSPRLGIARLASLALARFGIVVAGLEGHVGGDRSFLLPFRTQPSRDKGTGACIDRVAQEGMERVIARHRAAGAAVRAALSPLGLQGLGPSFRGGISGHFGAPAR